MTAETYWWQAKVGHIKEFQVALQKLRDKGANITQEVAETQIGVALMVFQQFGGINGISFYASETFASAGPHNYHESNVNGQVRKNTTNNDLYNIFLNWNGSSSLVIMFEVTKYALLSDMSQVQMLMSLMSRILTRVSLLECQAVAKSTIVHSLSQSFVIQLEFKGQIQWRYWGLVIIFKWCHKLNINTITIDRRFELCYCTSYILLVLLFVSNI